MRIGIASPGDPYLLLIGELAYAVTSLEGLLIFDIPRLSATLPAGLLDIPTLEGMTAGGIATAFTQTAGASSDTRVTTYFSQGGDSLRHVAGIRNDVLHARPATVGGLQRLVRRQRNGASFPIDDAWLENALDDVQREIDATRAVRPSFVDFPP